MCGSSPAPTAIPKRPSKPGRCVRICITACASYRFVFPRCGSAPAISCCSRSTSSHITGIATAAPPRRRHASQKPRSAPSMPALEQVASQGNTPAAASEITTEEPYYIARDRLVASFELQYLTQLVTEARGNMSRAARAAGLDRTTLYRLIERHGLQRKRIRETTDPTSL